MNRREVLFAAISSVLPAIPVADGEKKMAYVRHGDLIEIDGKIRIEKGPARKNAIATVELLDGLHSIYRDGGIDAMGRPIILGNMMMYADLLNEWGWYVYKLLPAEDAHEINIETWNDVIDGVPYRWKTQSFHEKFEDAESAANALLVGA